MKCCVKKRFMSLMENYIPKMHVHYHFIVIKIKLIRHKVFLKFPMSKLKSKFLFYKIVFLCETN